MLEGLVYDDVAALIERVTSKYGDMSVIKASIEILAIPGVSLMLARIRLVTDRGHFTADGEGYGARQALRVAADTIERQLLKDKTYGQSKQHRKTDEQAALYRQWLGG